MTRGRPAHAALPRRDMLEIWAGRCSSQFTLETGGNCLTCPDREECQRQADRFISGWFHGAQVAIRKGDGLQIRPAKVYNGSNMKRR